MSKCVIAIATAFLLVAAGVAEAGGGYRYDSVGYHHRGPYRSGYYRVGGGWGWGGGWGYRGGWGYGWGGGAPLYPGVFLGGPGPYGWGAPYPYYPQPLVVVPPQPQVYVQQPAPQQYWYYCENPKGYYPYVPQCRGEWLQVLPRTDAPNR